MIYDQEYISIKEFAERAGVSPQAIYKRLNQVGNQLINYIKPVGNQRMLNIRALQDIYGIEVDNQNQPVEQPVVNFSQPDQMQDQIRLLQDQLNSKDQQLREQAERDQKKDEQIRKLQDQLIEQDQRHHEQIQTMQELLSQAQKLHLLSVQRVQELEAQEAAVQQESIWKRIKGFFKA
mgnify:CR=1 FL=1